jgi:hypothetical protein
MGRGVPTTDQLLRDRCEKGKSVSTAIRLLDVVALTTDLPERGLRRGQVGTVVEILAPGVYEIEFSDVAGRTYASLALRADQLMVLHYQPVETA